jgi:hypothetical protein
VEEKFVVVVQALKLVLGSWLAVLVVARMLCTTLAPLQLSSVPFQFNIPLRGTKSQINWTKELL